MGSCFLHLLFDCFWYRRQGEDGGESVPADGGGGPVAAEGEELEPPADGGGAPPANEGPVAAPAPAAAPAGAPVISERQQKAKELREKAAALRAKAAKGREGE